MTPPATGPRKTRRIWRSAGTAVAILAIYVGSLLGYFWLDGSAQEIHPDDLYSATETVVLLDLLAIQPMDNRVEVNVVVLPDDSLLDPEFGVLNTDVTVRLYPSIDFGDLNYPEGRTPKHVATSMVASGDANRWPFDTYTTNAISAEVFVGAGETRRYVPARVEVSGALYGWDVRSERAVPEANSTTGQTATTIVFSRSNGPLALVAGICLVLVTLPALALFVAIEMLIGRMKFQPPFVTWFAALLFAVVPIRSVLPGDPPPGSWVDEAIVLWVLIALAAAMVIYVIAWYRRSD